MRVIVDDGEISFVGARADSTGEADVRELLELISPDVSRHNWIRVGNALKHMLRGAGWFATGATCLHVL